MRRHDSAFRRWAVALPPAFWGALGVAAFSGTLPATRLALPAFGPVTVGLGRAVVAAALAGLALAVRRPPAPTRAQWRQIAVVALGVVVGFPVLSALALRVVGASHGAVLVGLLPVATAVAAVARAGERPAVAFWVASLAGTAAVVAFALVQGAGHLRAADVLLLGAVAAGAVGYAEGGVLARRMPGWQVISWALLLSAPVLVPVCAVGLALRPPHAPDAAAWLGMAYVALVSMFLGFVAWYHGLARGGVARVGQIQLAQPVLTLLWAALLLGEHVGTATVVAALAVLVLTVLTQRARAAGTSPHARKVVSP
jgi:drug/metabolite transporter (DMT)-like permease